MALCILWCKLLMFFDWVVSRIVLNDLLNKLIDNSNSVIFCFIAKIRFLCSSVNCNTSSNSSTNQSISDCVAATSVAFEDGAATLELVFLFFLFFVIECSIDFTKETYLDILPFVETCKVRPVALNKLVHSVKRDNRVLFMSLRQSNTRTVDVN